MKAAVLSQAVGKADALWHHRERCGFKTVTLEKGKKVTGGVWVRKQ